MLKSRLYRTRIQTSQPFKLSNVLQVCIENFDTNPLTLIISDVVTKIPPATNVLGTNVPSLPFKIDSQVCPIEELRFSLEFQNATGDAVLSYTTLNIK